jgi:hypothetical protein
MSTHYSQGTFTPKNAEKYVGKGTPRYRSSWELSFMMECDKNPSIMKWASEAIRIPYRDPFTGKNTTYVPDFFIQYVDKNNIIHSEIVEIKPAKHQLKEYVGKNQLNKYNYIKNMAKWQAATAFCKAQGLTFRILNEFDMFQGTKKRK